MSIKFQVPVSTFTDNDFMWVSDKLVHSIARAALLNQTDAFIELLIDSQEMMEPEMLERSKVQGQLDGIKDDAKQFVEDVIEDLRSALLQKINQMKFDPIVTGIKYDRTGAIEDIAVDIEV